jgi:hypothetical protein
MAASKFLAVLVVLVATGTYFYMKAFSKVDCAQDPPIMVDGVELQACQMFSMSYLEARTKFRAAATARNAKLVSLPILQDDDGLDLEIDIAILKGGLPGYVVHSSGTHGIEGYAGSAIQLAILETLAKAPSQDRPTLVLIHAVNPYGMANYRRFNEHNVDLNRNAINNFEEFMKQRDNNVASYEDFRDFLSPPRKPTFWDMTLGYWMTGIPKLVEYGFTKMKRSMVAGQYHHPEGIFYGGTILQPSIQKVLEFVAPEILPETSVWIDVHTGLGAHGMDTVFAKGCSNTEQVKRYFPSVFSIVTPEATTQAAMGGYDVTQGVLVEYLQDHQHQHQHQHQQQGEKGNKDSLFLVHEFGTIPALLVGRSLILENQIHHWIPGPTKEEGRALKNKAEQKTDWMASVFRLAVEYWDRELKEWGRSLMITAFYPQKAGWRASVVQRGVELATQAMIFAKDHPSMITTTADDTPETIGEEELHDAGDPADK